MNVLHRTSIVFVLLVSSMIFNVSWADGPITIPTNQPPDCSQASPSIMSAWPPNKKFIDVNVLGVTDPDGDTISILIESIFQDETVDGEFAPDGKGVGSSTASVRAERDGSGNGRVYHITFIATDELGEECSAVVQVSIPHGQNGAPAVDDGALYDSTVVTP